MKSKLSWKKQWMVFTNKNVQTLNTLIFTKWPTEFCMWLKISLEKHIQYSYPDYERVYQGPDFFLGHWLNHCYRFYTIYCIGQRYQPHWWNVYSRCYDFFRYEFWLINLWRIRIDRLFVLLWKPTTLNWFYIYTLKKCLNINDISRSALKSYYIWNNRYFHFIRRYKIFEIRTRKIIIFAARREQQQLSMSANNDRLRQPLIC